MESVFISSIQRGFEEVRAATRAALESLGLQAVMAETIGAANASPQTALLDRVASSDVFLLLIGSRYGAPAGGGASPTEDEFDEARRRGKPILVLRQDRPLEPEQQAFLERATGGWKAGIFYGTFTDEADVGFAAVRAITNLRKAGHREELAGVAQQRAIELVRGSETGHRHGGALARVALVPLLPSPLLDALALEDAALPDDLADAARAARLVPHALGIEIRVAREGATLVVGDAYSGHPLEIGARAEVVTEISVEGSAEFGSLRVDPDRLRAAIKASVDFAIRVWERIDPRGEVQDAAVALAIPDAQHRVFGPSTGGRSLTTVGSFRMPETAVAPEPALVVRRADLVRDETVDRLVAEMRRVFVDAGAIQEI